MYRIPDPRFFLEGGCREDDWKEISNEQAFWDCTNLWITYYLSRPQEQLESEIRGNLFEEYYTLFPCFGDVLSDVLIPSRKENMIELLVAWPDLFERTFDSPPEVYSSTMTMLYGSLRSRMHTYLYKWDRENGDRIRFHPVNELLFCGYKEKVLYTEKIWRNLYEKAPSERKWAIRKETEAFGFDTEFWDMREELLFRFHNGQDFQRMEALWKMQMENYRIL